MNYYYFLGGTLSLVVLALAFFIAWRMVRKGSRADVGGTAAKALGLTMIGTLVGAFAWVPLVNLGAQAASESAVSEYCRDAREEIFRTVKDVDGLYVSNPSLLKGGDYHRGDSEANSYLKKPDRRYRFLEVGGFGARSGIRRYEAGVDYPQATRTTEITARYALTWIELQTIDEGNRGIFGDLTLIYDRETGEILARREFYYAVEQLSDRNRGTRLHPCPDVRLPADNAEPRFRRLDSYDFVSRVLIPPTMSAEEITTSYALAPGGGRKQQSCTTSIKVAPGVAREDLVATRVGMDLRLGLRNRDDMLICSDFYFSVRESGDRKVLLADGTAVPYSEFANLRDLQQGEFERLKVPPGAPHPRDALAQPSSPPPVVPVPAQDRNSEYEETPPTKIYRWVDQDGVVHYGDAREAPAEARQ